MKFRMEYHEICPNEDDLALEDVQQVIDDLDLSKIIFETDSI